MHITFEILILRDLQFDSSQSRLLNLDLQFPRPKGRPNGVTPKYSLKALVPLPSELLGVEAHVQIKYPEPTKHGLEFAFAFGREDAFYVWPEADMLLSQSRSKSFAEWGKGWADPEIRKQRRRFLKRNRPWKPPRRTNKQTVRGRLAAKLLK